MPNWIHVFLPLCLWWANGLTDSWFLPPVWGQPPDTAITELPQQLKKSHPEIQPGLTSLRLGLRIGHDISSDQFGGGLFRNRRVMHGGIHGS